MCKYGDMALHKEILSAELTLIDMRARSHVWISKALISHSVPLMIFESIAYARVSKGFHAAASAETSATFFPQR